VDVTASGVVNIVVGLAVVAWLIMRQLRVRPFDEAKPYRIVVILGAIGLLETARYLQAHPLGTSVYLVVLAGLLLAGGFGYLRALTVRVWRRTDGVLVSQGNLLTAGLWLAGIGVHLGLDLLLGRISHPAAGLGSVSLLLYLAVTLAAQRWVITGRARRLAGDRTVPGRLA
jgi:hypothetical protein